MSLPRVRHYDAVSSTTLKDVPAQSLVVFGCPRVDAVRARRLAELGLRAGARIRVLIHTAGGGRLVAVGDSRIALDRHTASQLLIVTDEQPVP